MADEPVVEQKPTPKEPETFSREYVTELRNENKTYRLKAQEEVKKAEAAAEAIANAKKEADERISKATEASNERIKRAELKAIAIKAGIVDLDGLKLADLSKVKLNDAGEVEGADALIDDLKKSKPYLFGTTTTSSTQEKPKPDTKPKRVSEMTDAEREAEAKRRGF